MTKYIEDVFIDFSNRVFSGSVITSTKDFAVIRSFYDTLRNYSLLTEKQRNFILALMHKYQTDSANSGLEYGVDLQYPVWRTEVRTLDTSKKMWIENYEGIWTVRFKFPFSFKEIFSENFPNRSELQYDSVTKTKFGDVCMLDMAECIQKAIEYEFEIDQSVNEIIDEIITIQEEKYNYLPHSVIENNRVILKNTSKSADNFWEQHNTSNLDKDIFMARKLGYFLKDPNEDDLLQKLCSKSSNLFWLKGQEQLINIITRIEQWPVMIILDRACDTKKWVTNFVNAMEEVGFDTSKICIVSRKSNKNPLEKQFNDWIKETRLGGPVENSDIFICNHKPPSWAFTNTFIPQVVVSNALVENLNGHMDYLKKSHTGIYLSDFKPTKIKTGEPIEAL